MKLPKFARGLTDAVMGAARGGIERRMGGYRQAAHRVDPTLPERVTGDGPRVAVVGGGIAGITAATTLAERGFRVTLYERERYLGGKTGAWAVDVDGDVQLVDHGFHAFFAHYYNLRGLMERAGVTAKLKRIESYEILRRDGTRISIKDVETAPLLNLLGLASTGVYSVRDLLFSKRLYKLDPFLRYDEAVTFRDWDHVAYDDFVRDADLPGDLRLVFNTFARAFFSEGDRLSVAALVRAFHFYYLSNDGGLLYDYLDDDYETAFAGPLRRRYESLGGTVVLGAEVQGVDPDEGARWRVAGEPYDAVILASDVKGTKRIIEGSPALRERHPAFAERVARQRCSQRYAVLRLWMDRDATGELPVFVITDRLRALDAVTAVHRVVPAAREWAALNGGGVYELHCYAVPDAMSEPELRAALVEELEHYLPALKGATAVREYLHVRDDFAAFHVGTHAERAEVETGVEGLYLAGDWVRLPFPATLMEAACASGLLAANAALRTAGLRDAEVWSVPKRGILAR